MLGLKKGRITSISLRSAARRLCTATNLKIEGTNHSLFEEYYSKVKVKHAPLVACDSKELAKILTMRLEDKDANYLIKSLQTDSSSLEFVPSRRQSWFNTWICKLMKDSNDPIIQDCITQHIYPICIPLALGDLQLLEDTKAILAASLHAAAIRRASTSLDDLKTSKFYDAVINSTKEIVEIVPVKVATEFSYALDEFVNDKCDHTALNAKLKKACGFHVRSYEIIIKLLKLESDMSERKSRLLIATKSLLETQCAKLLAEFAKSKGGISSAATPPPAAAAVEAAVPATNKDHDLSMDSANELVLRPGRMFGGMYCLKTVMKCHAINDLTEHMLEDSEDALSDTSALLSKLDTYSYCNDRISRTIFIDNLPEKVDSSYLVEAFRKCGEVESVKLFSGKFLDCDELGKEAFLMDDEGGSGSGESVTAQDTIGEDMLPPDGVVGSIHSDELLTPTDPDFHSHTLDAVTAAAQKEADNSAVAPLGALNPFAKFSFLDGMTKHKGHRKKVLERIRSDAHAFVTMKTATGYELATAPDVRLFGLCIERKNCRVKLGSRLRTVYVELADALCIASSCGVIKSILGPNFDIKAPNAMEQPQQQRPVFVHLEFPSHFEASIAYDLLEQHTIKSTLTGKSTVHPSWIKTQWYWMVAEKAKQMKFRHELNAWSAELQGHNTATTAVTAATAVTAGAAGTASAGDMSSTSSSDAVLSHSHCSSHDVNTMHF